MLQQFIILIAAIGLVASQHYGSPLALSNKELKACVNAVGVQLKEKHCKKPVILVTNGWQLGCKVTVQFTVKPGACPMQDKVYVFQCTKKRGSQGLDVKEIG